MFTLKLTDAHILGMIMAYLLGFFIMPYVIWFAKKNNLYFVFDLASGGVVYKSDKAVDVTSMVKKELGILQ